MREGEGGESEPPDSRESEAYADILGRYANTPKGRGRVMQALGHALDIIAEKGIEPLSLREVARRCGITVGNLQHYFDSRHSLLDAVLAYLARQYDVNYSGIDQSGDARQRFENVIRYLLKDIRSPRTNAVFFELWAFANRDPGAAEILAGAYRHHLANLERLILEMSGSTDPAAAARKAILVAAMIEGLMVFMAQRSHLDFDADEIERLCMGQIMAVATD
ncbi:TetR/AcrR family transcriptional regulator [Magnetospirillum sp. 15-1]|uniref:TetR/AcrR family transcriptional regulator n=1 Tax=Magnetospirillum sp. 15-1 TaxID=1979370 RepID=UPI000BBC48AA|nr:TetR/AcrR family transcriptional regulator [Magnetospirillum sp. 15-1]